MAIITINGITVDPLAPHRAFAARAVLEEMRSNDASKFDYILVQTTHPLNREEKREFAERGASILEYIPQDTYLCHFPPSERESLLALKFVSWTAPYDKGFKLRPALIGLERKGTVR